MKNFISIFGSTLAVLLKLNHVDAIYLLLLSHATQDIFVLLNKIFFLIIKMICVHYKKLIIQKCIQKLKALTLLLGDN